MLFQGDVLHDIIEEDEEEEADNLGKGLEEPESPELVMEIMTYSSQTKKAMDEEEDDEEDEDDATNHILELEATRHNQFVSPGDQTRSPPRLHQ